MKLAMMQPYFLPYIGYFQLINAVDKFVIYDDVNYISKGWINRNRILVHNQAHLFTIPLIKANPNRLIMDIDICNDDPWRQKLLKTIEVAYKKAPYYTEVEPLLRRIINHVEERCTKFNYHSIKSVCEYLDIKTEIVPSSIIFDNNHLSGQNRVLDICKTMDVSEYLNPIGGINLFNRDSFITNGINIQFLQTSDVSYTQFYKTFIPSLIKIPDCGR